MIILRKLFSKDKSDRGERVSNQTNSMIKGAAAIGAGIGLNTALGLKLMNHLQKSSTPEEKAQFEKLKNGVTKSGIVKSVSNASYMQGPAYHPGFDNIGMAGIKDPGSLGHEAGHAYYEKQIAGKIKGKGAADKIGKYSHKAYFKMGGTAGTFMGLSPLSGIASGAISGTRAAKKEAKGEKESKLNRHMAWALPVMVAAPGLVAEGMASRKGIRMLKESGASKKIINNAKKSLAGAWGTYGALTAANAGVGELSRGIAYKCTKKKLERNKKKED